MAVKMRRNFSGEFAARDLGNGTWRLSQPNGVEIFLRGVDAVESAALSAPALSDLGIEWRGHLAVVTLKSKGGAASAAAGSAWAHEPLPNLYDALPLAEFDGKARRFWRRVFWLVRMPGGRRLLKYFARAGRKRGQ
jgi:hypothetical protein